MCKNVRPVWLLLFCVTFCGCVERDLTLRSEPEGARVFLNDEEVGQTPVTVAFQWYGDYRVRCTKAGYEALETHRVLRAPWYSYFPIDFFANILYPGRIEEHYTWSFTLAPRQPLDREALIDSALRMQQRLEDPNAVASTPPLTAPAEQAPPR
jgi:hypothetical protein